MQNHICMVKSNIQLSDREYELLSDEDMDNYFKQLNSK